MNKAYNPNKLIIDKQAIKRNIDNIRKFVGNSVEIMPIIKANAYGIGIDNILPILVEKKIKHIGIANVNEGILVRKKFKGQILVLLQPLIQQIPEIIKNKLTTNVCDYDFLYELNRQSKINNSTSNVHIEIDTGMGRTGIKVDDIENFLNKVQNLSNINIIGLSSHLSSSGSNETYSYIQIKTFERAIEILENHKICLKYIHIYASGGTLMYPIKYSNMVRTGIMLYGYYPGKNRNIKLYPSLKLITKISYIHLLKKGECIGYNCIYNAKKDMKVAIIPIGFADAFMGLESNIASVLIRNKKAKIIAICMDTMIVDITEINDAKINDDVILWDNEHITLEQWGEWTDTSNYEVLSILSDRIERKIL